MATNISTLTIHATPEKVWNTLTQAELVKQWQYGSELLTDWKPGSPIRFRTAWEDKVFEQWGTVLEFDPARKLRYSLYAPRPDLEDKPENYFEMEYRLTEQGNNTLLEIIQEDNRPGAKQEAPQGEENPILKMLKDLIEQE
jgi:uncharacterized protein YndB with AHSA1/START domain